MESAIRLTQQLTDVIVPCFSVSIREAAPTAVRIAKPRPAMVIYERNKHGKQKLMSYTPTSEKTSSQTRGID